MESKVEKMNDPISLSKYRIRKELREQEIFKELNNYEHKDTLEEMRNQENSMLIKYIK